MYIGTEVFDKNISTYFLFLRGEYLLNHLGKMLDQLGKKFLDKDYYLYQTQNWLNFQKFY